MPKMFLLCGLSVNIWQMKVVPCYVKWNSVCLQAGQFTVINQTLVLADIILLGVKMFKFSLKFYVCSMKYEGTNGPNSEDDLSLHLLKIYCFAGIILNDCLR